MKTDQIVELFLLALVIFTVIGMALKSDVFWQIYNYGTILGSVLCGLLLLKRK